MTTEAAGLGDHPHIDPGDGRTECYLCGKFVHDVIHSCKGVPVTRAAEERIRVLIDAVRKDERARLRAALTSPEVVEAAANHVPLGWDPKRNPYANVDEAARAILGAAAETLGAK